MNYFIRKYFWDAKIDWSEKNVVTLTKVSKGGTTFSNSRFGRWLMMNTTVMDNIIDESLSFFKCNNVSH